MKECTNCKTKENLYIYKGEIYCLDCLRNMLPSAKKHYCECCSVEKETYLLDGFFICDECLEFALIKLTDIEYEKLIHRRLLEELDDFFNEGLSNE